MSLYLRKLNLWTCMDLSDGRKKINFSRNFWVARFILTLAEICPFRTEPQNPGRRSSTCYNPYLTAVPADACLICMMAQLNVYI